LSSARLQDASLAAPLICDPWIDARALRVIHHNPVSRSGGVHFFRESPTESTSVFEIVYPS
jgi:hypothetical protein